MKNKKHSKAVGLFYFLKSKEVVQEGKAEEQNHVVRREGLEPSRP
ncbi:hypothetical protein [Rahnella woolbedingensis]|nr:hypothetical protein [Rahnella woolbedingensis]